MSADIEEIPPLDAEKARAVITEAQNFEVYEGPMPEDDQTLIEEASEIVKMARTSAQRGTNSEPITAILFAAGVDHGGVQHREEEPPQGDDLPEGYDDMKVSQVLALLEEMDPEHVELVKSYEAGHKDRKTIMEFEPEAASDPKPAATPDDPAGDDGEDMSFDGYDDAPTEAILEIMGTLTPKQVEQTKAYEREHQNRPEVVDYGGADPTPVGSSAEEPAASSASSTPPARGDEVSLVDSYDEGLLATISDREGLPAPRSYQGEDPELPLTLEELSEQRLRQLHLAFHSLQARADYLLGLEEGYEIAARRIGADKFADVFAEFLEDEKSSHEGKVSASALDSLRSSARHRADADIRVKTWRDRETRHAIEARDIRSRRDGYSSSCARLSREHTMRYDEVATAQPPQGGRR